MLKEELKMNDRRHPPPGTLAGNDPTIEPSFSLQNRLMRALWNLVWALLFRPSPRLAHRWRAMLLRTFGAQLGPHVHIYPSVKVWAPWNLACESHVGVGDGANLYSMALISLGHHVVVSQGAHLCTGSHDIHSANFQLVASPIRIEPYVWICAEAFIGPGTSVAEGCIVGARSVVMRSLTEGWRVWVGNPARETSQRRNLKISAVKKQN